MLHENESLLVHHPQTVYDAEAGKIAGRRAKAWGTGSDGQPVNWAPQAADGKDCVGLALSGGGIRAASLGLGVLQAFCRNGLIRSIDYLSTVSGGGYIGSHFSSAVIAKRVPPERAFDDVDARPTVDGAKPEPLPGLPNDVRKLIYGGKYLFRPWEAANKYLIGLVLTAIVMFSGIMALAALVALLWRLLDTVVARDFLSLFELNSDVFAVFLPFFVFSACWFVAWLLSFFRFQAEAPGRWAQRWLYLAFAAALIGCVLLLVNGKETKLGFLSVFLDQGSKVEATGSISKWLLGLLAAALLPLLAPKKLIRMGLAQDKLWNRVVFRAATFAFLVGVPLAMVGFLGMRNISNTAVDKDENLRAGDIRNWPAFAALLGGPYDTLTAGEARRMTEINSRVDRNSLSPREAQTYLGYCVRNLVAQRERLDEQEQRLKDYSRWHRLYFLAGWPVSTDNPLRETWRAQRRLESEKMAVCALVNEYVLGSKLLPVALVKKEPLVNIVGAGGDSVTGRLLALMPQFVGPFGPWLSPMATALSTAKPLAFDSSRLDPDVAKAVSDDKELLSDDRDLKETLADAELSYTTFWRVEDAKDFNQSMLRTLHPECFYLPGKAYRWIVTAGDEWFRVKALGWALLAFGVGLTVDMNRTSLHRFYRNRLTRAYLVPQGPARPDVNLSELNTTDHGAPYHLINTTLELTRPRFLDEVDEECDKVGVDRRDRQSFVFSQLYCGATATGWMPTKEYESYLKENISLGDAMALSGAAADAMLANSLPVTVLMTALNLTLGQWIPNARKGRPWSNARAGVLLRDWFRPVEEADYCFVCDGGFTDNLGILALLKRRCQVIIALDSTCDSKQEFADLGGVLRAARIQEGVQIVEPRRPDQTLDTSPLERDSCGNCRRHFLLARIIYPKTDRLSESRGWLVYLKPSFTSDEGSDLLDYRRQQCEFPHHATADQFYDATRFECYRQLGAHIATALSKELTSDERATSLNDRLAALDERLATAPAAAPPVRASVHRVSRSVEVAAELLEDMAHSLRDLTYSDTPPQSAVAAPESKLGPDISDGPKETAAVSLRRIAEALVNRT